MDEIGVAREALRARARRLGVLAPGSDDYGQIWLMRADGSKLRLLLPYNGKRDATIAATFSPRGKKIVFSALNRDASSRELYIVNVDEGS